MTGTNERKLSTREKEIINAIEHNNGIRIKDLAKLLGMWDSNLRKKINLLVQRGLVERLIEDKYTCVRIKEETKTTN